MLQVPQRQDLGTLTKSKLSLLLVLFKHCSTRLLPIGEVRRHFLQVSIPPDNQSHNYIPRGHKFIYRVLTTVEPYSDDEVRAMLGVCDDDARFRYRYLGIRNKAIISLFAAGLRVEELSLIRLSSLDSRLQEVRVMSKGAKVRVVPISREARKALKQYLTLRLPGVDELWLTGGRPADVASRGQDNDTEAKKAGGSC